MDDTREDEMAKAQGGDYASAVDLVKRLAEPFERRKARAGTRLRKESGLHWYFAVLGLQTAVDRFDFESFARLQRVEDAPGEIELASALRDSHLFGAIGRYSHYVQYEIQVSRELVSKDDSAFTLAWWIVSALRVRTLAELLIPAVADHSWSTIAAIGDRSCHAQLLEDVPQARRLSEPVEVTRADLQWVESHLVRFACLLEIPSFRLAVEALSTHHHQTNERMMVAMLWSGIEALFGVQSELRFRLATSIASALEPRGSGRRELYGQVKRLYDLRSKAVHGTAVSQERLREHLIEVRRLLSRLLCAFSGAGRVPTEEDIENSIFV